MKLKDRIALVTGANSGIGRAIALGMAREGADVIIHYFEAPEAAEQTLAEITALGRNGFTIQADIRDVTQIKAMFAQVRDRFGRLDVLVNNAGITGWTELFEVTEAQWDAVIDTNLKGTFFCTQEAARLMREGGRGGSIINISTICAHLAVKNLVAYAASKGGVHAITKQLAVGFAPYQIRVNTFGPGATLVERTLRDDPDYARTWGAMVPMGRVASVEDMVGPALFLASDDSRYMTGQLFFVDGGWTVNGRIPEEHMDQVLKKNN